jgi:hypothetical protein
LKSPVLGNLKLKETIAVTCWYLWWQRREHVKGECVAGPRRTAFAIQALTSNFIPAASASCVVCDISWKKPSRGTYELNVDAAFHSNGRGAAGVVLRDDRGDAIAGLAYPLSHVHDATAAEALALHKGLVFLLEIGLTRVLSLIPWRLFKLVMRRWKSGVHIRRLFMIASQRHKILIILNLLIVIERLIKCT